ncbi:hypothetical protein LPJ77_005764, partial [Coemansia sp. RSA 2523]
MGRFRSKCFRQRMHVRQGQRRRKLCLAICTSSRCGSARITSWWSCAKSLRRTRTGLLACGRHGSSGRT